MSLYKTLELDASASFEEIKRSYQRKVLQLHPDKAGPESRDAFDAVQAAWLTLSDEALRNQYDSSMSRSSARLPEQDAVHVSELIYDVANACYRFPCRCGGDGFVVCEAELRVVDVVACDSCSLVLRIVDSG